MCSKQWMPSYVFFYSPLHTKCVGSQQQVGNNNKIHLVRVKNTLVTAATAVLVVLMKLKVDRRQFSSRKTVKLT